MAEAKSIVTYQTREYGVVKVKLAALMDRRGITRNRLRTLTGIKYDVIDRYYKNEVVSMVDMDFQNPHGGAVLPHPGLPGGGRPGI